MKFLRFLLFPFAIIYDVVTTIRNFFFNVGVFKQTTFNTPVIVVGNLSVGGTGKTPLVIYLVEQLRAQGLTPGVISRGYSGKAPSYPFAVTLEADVAHSGDEPALIVKRTNVAMVVGPDRKAAIEALLAENAVDVIISDDGLQHLALQRDIEICIVDESTVSNNEHLLPAGPYREPLSRLMSVDFIVRHGGDIGNAANQFTMSLLPGEPQRVKSQLVGAGKQGDFPSKGKIHAVAGIGNPQRFFDTCASLNYSFVPHAFADHHHFTVNDISFNHDTVLMTEKDAVKCVDMANEHHWYLPVNAQLSDGLISGLMEKLNNNFRLQRVSERLTDTHALDNS